MANPKVKLAELAADAAGEVLVKVGEAAIKRFAGAVTDRLNSSSTKADRETAGRRSTQGQGASGPQWRGQPNGSSSVDGDNPQLRDGRTANPASYLRHVVSGRRPFKWSELGRSVSAAIDEHVEPTRLTRTLQHVINEYAPPPEGRSLPRRAANSYKQFTPPSSVDGRSHADRTEGWLDDQSSVNHQHQSDDHLRDDYSSIDDGYRNDNQYTQDDSLRDGDWNDRQPRNIRHPTGSRDESLKALNDQRERHQKAQMKEQMRSAELDHKSHMLNMKANQAKSIAHIHYG